MTISVTTLKQYLWLESNSFISIQEAKYFVEKSHIFVIKQYFFFYLPLLLLIENQKLIPKYLKIQNCSPLFQGAKGEIYTPAETK